MPAMLKNVDNENAIKNKLKVIFLVISYLSFHTFKISIIILYTIIFNFWLAEIIPIS
jgi:hypothetical protein